jgi:hypothetical protein
MEFGGLIDYQSRLIDTDASQLVALLSRCQVFQQEYELSAVFVNVRQVALGSGYESASGKVAIELHFPRVITEGNACPEAGWIRGGELADEAARAPRSSARVFQAQANACPDLPRAHLADFHTRNS